MSSAATSRTIFLDKASLLLAAAAPAVSAELRSSLNNDPAYSKIASQDDVCACKSCGTILLPGWNCSTLRRTTERRTRQDRLTKNPASKSLSLQCSQCNFVTTVESAKPARQGLNKAIRTQPNTSTKSRNVSEDGQRDLTKPNTVIPGTTESAPRKRSRNNKKSTLQALLADRKSSGKSKTSGLDIMDFVKT